MIPKTTHSPGTQPPKRGWPAQRPRREQERQVRCRAVDFDHWALDHELSQPQAAAHLDLAPGTLADWNRRWEKDRLKAQPLGRPCGRGTPRERNAVIDLMRNTGPCIGLPALRTAFPDIARGELQYLQARFRYHWKRNHQRLIHVLDWHRPGTVWAMDHAHPLEPVDDHWPVLLAVRDLSSGCQLFWCPVPDEAAQTTIDALQWLFLQHGPPLVLKCDNGPGFTSEEMQTFLDRWQVRPLYSPPYLPSYNGACEAGIGAMKIRTHDQATKAGRAGLWNADDCEAARRMANEFHYPRRLRGRTPAQSFQARTRLSEDEQAAFGRSLQQHHTAARAELSYPQQAVLDFQDQAAVDRVAIRRALVDRGFLSFTRRSITPPLPSRNSLEIW